MYKPPLIKWKEAPKEWGKASWSGNQSLGSPLSSHHWLPGNAFISRRWFMFKFIYSISRQWTPYYMLGKAFRDGKGHGAHASIILTVGCNEVYITKKFSFFLIVTTYILFVALEPALWIWDWKGALSHLFGRLLPLPSTSPLSFSVPASLPRPPHHARQWLGLYLFVAFWKIIHTFLSCPCMYLHAWT